MKLVDGSLTLKQALSFFFFFSFCNTSVPPSLYCHFSFGLFPPLASFKYDAMFSTPPSVLRKASVPLCSCDLKTSLPELNWKAVLSSLTRAADAISAPALSLCLCCMINL